MVGEVLAHAAQLLDHLDPVLFEQVAAADAGQLQDLGRLHRAGGQDHFLARGDGRHLARAADLDTGGGLVLDQHAGDDRVGHDVQVMSMLGRAQVADGRGRAEATMGGVLQVRRALVVTVVVVLLVFEPSFLRTLHVGVGQFVEVLQAGHADGAVLAAQGRVARGVALHLLEVGQHVVPAPAGQAHVLPGIELRRIAADIDVAVDRA